MEVTQHWIKDKTLIKGHWRLVIWKIILCNPWMIYWLLVDKHALEQTGKRLWTITAYE